MKGLLFSCAAWLARAWHRALERRDWLYLLALVPILSDIVETGTLPSTLRGWFTEILVGTIILLLASRIRRDYLTAIALSRVDALTALSNRRAFDERLETELARAHRSQEPLSLVVIDLDNLKLVNDRLGHDAGDAALCRLAQAMRHAVRVRIDGAFRLGGDEFAVLLPGSDARAAAAVIARVRLHFAQGAATIGNDCDSFSAGIVELETSETALQLVQRADSMMYEQKSARKNGA